MHKDKFLTVYAVFDSKTQIKLKEWQDRIINNGLNGHQTMDIPFHISLGSFPIEQKETLIKQLQIVAKTHSPFAIELCSIQTFGNKVLYLESNKSPDIENLHLKFDCNYGDGMPFVPHTTIFIGEERETLIAKQILTAYFEPICATITEIHLSEFFPTKFISYQKLHNKQ